MSVLLNKIGFSVKRNLVPSLLFCHSIFWGFGVDKTSDLMVVVDPKQTDESTIILTLGTSVKKNTCRSKFSKIKIKYTKID